MTPFSWSLLYLFFRDSQHTDWLFYVALCINWVWKSSIYDSIGRSQAKKKPGSIEPGLSGLIEQLVSTYSTKHTDRICHALYGQYIGGMTHIGSVFVGGSYNIPECSLHHPVTPFVDLFFAQEIFL